MAQPNRRNLACLNYMYNIISFLILYRAVQVLDMCAAPGSKTAQLIEALHAEDSQESTIPGVCVWGGDDSLLYMYTSNQTCCVCI